MGLPCQKFKLGFFWEKYFDSYEKIAPFFGQEKFDIFKANFVNKKKLMKANIG